MPTVDCSDEARRDRQDAIRDLRAQLRRPVQSVSDRSRSVSYRSLADIRAVLGDLERDEAICEAGGRRASRWSHWPMVKGL